MAPIRIHPQNPKIFEGRGAPRVLVCATEHYGAVMNRPFRFDRYLDDAAAKLQTLTRTFMLFREFQNMYNPYSTCKPESTDYIAPFCRVGPDLAADGLPKFNLSQPNPEFFDRLHRFLSKASQLGIVVEVVLLSNTYMPEIWAANPLNRINNVNDVEDIRWPDYLSRRHPKLFAWQTAHVRKIVEETNRYDNIFYEICNEPGGAAGGPDDPTIEEVNDWQMAIAKVIRETESRLPNQHLIAGQEALVYNPLFEQRSDKSFGDFGIDVVNIHPLPNTVYAGKTYYLGGFMSKELSLEPLRDYCLAAYDELKPLNMDEDNTASRFKDFDGWTIHRKRAWTTLLCGGHYDYIDFSIINYCETGTEESQRCIRTWMRHLSDYIHSIDLVRAKPIRDRLRGQPAATVASVFGVADEDISIYLADGRELTDKDAGRAIGGQIILDLPEGEYQAAWFSPVDGTYDPPLVLRGGNGMRLAVPAFTHDAVLRIRKRG
ncbi:MAG: cellulase family glycosylhydrolase [Phycisphaerae bacterium]|nr:cellulase family glycosylhydrolase [Phycisphaerae bacterium]